jgi:hypothetical protein
MSGDANNPVQWLLVYVKFYACVAKSGYLGPGDQMQWKDQGGLTQHKLNYCVGATNKHCLPAV